MTGVESIKNPFADDWQACLCAHYQYVIAQGDTNNEASLREVLLHLGFAEEYLHALRLEVVGSAARAEPPAETDGRGHIADRMADVGGESAVLDEALAVTESDDAPDFDGSAQLTEAAVQAADEPADEPALLESKHPSEQDSGDDEPPSYVQMSLF